MSRDSKLGPYEQEIRSLRGGNVSFREIAREMKLRHDLEVSHNAVYSFLCYRDQRAKPPGLFYANMPADLTASLIKQMTALWTCDSTGIEGNTLSLGETIKVLEMGLTISGKPLKDHEEVYGHARGIDLIFDLLHKPKVEAEDLYNLHRCVMQKCPIDYLNPVGSWKREHNGTTGVMDGKPFYMEYASPTDTPRLMARWLKELNRKLASGSSASKARNTYTWIHHSLVRIHPFFDGNGRVARLIANLPVLRGGHPPILISREQRVAYIDHLWNYQQGVGLLTREATFLPPHPAIDAFKRFVQQEWKASLELVTEARALAEKRGESLR